MTYVKIYIDFLDDAENLNDAQLGRLVRAMLRYANRAIEPDLRGREAILWPAMRKQIDREFQNYEKICERNRKNRSAKKKPAEPVPAPAADFPAITDFPAPKSFSAPTDSPAPDVSALSAPFGKSTLDQW